MSEKEKQQKANANKLTENTRSLIEVLKARMQIYDEAFSSMRQDKDEAKYTDLFSEVNNPLCRIEDGELADLDFSMLDGIFNLLREDFLFSFSHVEMTDEIDHVAYLGTEGSYSYNAAQKYFSARTDTINLIGHRSFADIINAVEEGQCIYGILPIENTTSGSINEAFDCLHKSSVSIVAELAVSVQHSLIGLNSASTDEIKEVLSHPQALTQCSEFLQSLDNCQIVPVSSTAEGIKRVATLNDPTVFAIGNASIANLYGLSVLKTHVANNTENFTRFFVLSKKQRPVPHQIPAKTTLIFTTGEQAGALLDCLIIFKELNVGLSKIESRPSQFDDDEEIFYVDVDINVRAPNFNKIAKHLKKYVKTMKVLGCYPKILRL
ncbi:MAG: prephenate dehydratase [Pseudomonadota bacterium]